MRAIPDLTRRVLLRVPSTPGLGRASDPPGASSERMVTNDTLQLSPARRGRRPHPILRTTPGPGCSLSADETGAGLATMLPADKPKASLLRVVGPSGALDVWLGDAGDDSALEADVRDVSARGIAGLPALAMALGDVATRHKLEVRVIPRMDSAGSSVLVLFGDRTYRAK